MKRFIIIADKRKYLVLSIDEDKARIKFSQNFPSLKIKSITETLEEVFNIIE